MKKMLVPFLVLMLAGTATCPPGLAQAAYKDASLDETTQLDSIINLPGGSKKISLDVSNENIRSVLHDLASQGGFNLVMDESVTGNITVSLNNVSLNQAVQSVSALGDLLVVKQSGGIYLAISRQAAQDKGIARQLSKVIRIYYSNANRIANVLNQSIFASAGASASGASGGGTASSGSAGGSGGATGGIQKAKADPRTNTIVIVGTSREIELAEAAVAKLDVPRQSKTFYLSHSNALDVSTMLASSIFNDGLGTVKIGAATSSSSGGGGTGTNAVNPSSVRVERQDIQEGSGINSFGGGSGGSSGVTSGLSSTVMLRGFAKTSDTLSVSPEGALIIPDTRQNAITIMGTAEQIALAESLIPTLDAQLPQVAIEASLIEISDTGIKELSTRLGLADGKLQSGFNNTAVDSVGQTSTRLPTGLIGMPTVDATDTNSYGRSGIVFTTNPILKNSDYLLQLRTLVTDNKAKILANPTIVATHDTESIISIVDEIIRRVTTQVDPSGFSTQTVEIGEAGIVMDILPKIGEDGTISMRLRPSVTSVLSQQRDTQGNLITLLSKRDLLTQNVRIRDGQTLVLGGLIQQRDTMRADKLPGASDLPIVGAMFRASQSNRKRSEIVLLVTPHIVNNTKLTPVNTTTTMNNAPLQTSLAGGK